MTEAEWAGQIIETARWLDWRVAHFRPALTARGYRTPVQGDGAGFPDLVCVRGPRLLAVELKAEKGRLAPAQLDWLQRFAAVQSVEAHVWRPADRDAAERILRRAA